MFVVCGIRSAARCIFASRCQVSASAVSHQPSATFERGCATGSLMAYKKLYYTTNAARGQEVNSFLLLRFAEGNHFFILHILSVPRPAAVVSQLCGTVVTPKPDHSLVWCLSNVPSLDGRFT